MLSHDPDWGASCHIPARRENLPTKIIYLSTVEEGRGFITDRSFLEGDFVCEYCGDVIDLKEAMKREDARSRDQSCFMLYFEYDGKKLW